MSESTQKYTSRFISAIISPFVSALIVSLIYARFAARFHWPQLSYWDCFLALMLLGSIGYQFTPVKRIEWALEDMLKK